MRNQSKKKAGPDRGRSPQHSCWKCGAEPLTDEARRKIRNAARREIIRLANRRPEDDGKRASDPHGECDQRIAQLLLDSHDVNAIMWETLEPPTVLIQSLLRLTWLSTGGTQ